MAGVILQSPLESAKWDRPGGAYPICLILAWTKGSSIAFKKELLGISDGRKWGLTTYGLYISYICIDYLDLFGWRFAEYFRFDLLCIVQLAKGLNSIF